MSNDFDNIKVGLEATGHYSYNILDVYDVEVIGEDDEEEVIQGDFAGRVRVVKSTEKYTICELLSNGIGIKKGMLAYPPAPAAPAAPQAQPQAQPQPQWGNAPF